MVPCIGKRQQVYNNSIQAQFHRCWNKNISEFQLTGSPSIPGPPFLPGRPGVP